MNENEILTGEVTEGQYAIDYQDNGNGAVIPIIDGVEHPELMMGYATESDKKAGLKVLADALRASGNDVYKAMRYMYNAARVAANNITPNEAVDVDGTEVLLDLENGKAYIGTDEVANIDDLEIESREAVRALLMERTRNELQRREAEREREYEEYLLMIDDEYDEDEDW